MKHKIVVSLITVTLGILFIGCALNNESSSTVVGDDKIINSNVENVSSDVGGDMENTDNMNVEIYAEDINSSEHIQKDEWITNKLQADLQEIKDLNIVSMPFKVTINGKDFDNPFTGKQLLESGIAFNSESYLYSDSVSFGDKVIYTDDNKTKSFDLGFINKTDDELQVTDCYVASIYSTNDGIILKSTSNYADNDQENYNETNYIKIGTSFGDVLELLTRLGCKIYYTAELNELEKYSIYLNKGYSDYNKLVQVNDTTKLNLRFANTVPKVDDDSDIDTKSLRIDYFDISLWLTNDQVSSISYDYSLVNYDEYSRRYRDMYE